MKNPHRHNWPISLYWTIMLGVPGGGLVAMLMYYVAIAFVQYLCRHGVQ